MPYQKEMHSRDTTILIDLLWFNVMQYSSLLIKQYGSNCLVGITEVWGFLH